MRRLILKLVWINPVLPAASPSHTLLTLAQTKCHCEAWTEVVTRGSSGNPSFIGMNRDQGT